MLVLVYILGHRLPDVLLESPCGLLSMNEVNEMRLCRGSVLVFVCLLAGLAVADNKKEDWVTLTPQETQMKEVPGDPGASAIQFYYADFIENNLHTEFIHKCIKVLTEKGKQYADVEIPILSDTGLKDLKARTIHPDGSIVEFTGKPYEKTLIKGRGVKILAKTFTLPDVTVGSIIEYKYRLTDVWAEHWVLQHDLYTVHQEFKFVPGAYIYDYFGGGSQIAWIILHTRDVQVKKVNGNNAELEMQNVPAFVSEDSMPPRENYEPSVRFFYLPGEVTSAEKYWQEVTKILYEYTEQHIGNHKEVKEAALQAIGSEQDPEKKLRLLYARAQQIRNLSFERERTEKEQKKEKLKDNEGIKDVLKRGYGDRDDITMLFVAMARSAGFDASVLFVSSRSGGFFIREVPSISQFHSQIALVKLNGKDLYLDPGTKYCPFGLLPWWRTSTAALQPDKKVVNFSVVPAFNYDKAQTQRTANVALDENGDLKGDIEVQFKDMEGLEHRLDAYQRDQAGKTKDLEDELSNWLPHGAVVKLKDVKNWEDGDKPLIATFDVQVPGYASVMGKRLLIPAHLFQLKQKDAFSHPDRKYPLYFPYAFGELDSVKFKIPSGFSSESIPTKQEATLPYATYQSASRLIGNELLSQRALFFNVIFSDVPKFPELKGFFNKVQAGDEQQAVLKVGGSTDAQKTN